MKQEPTEPHGFIKPNSVGIPRLQAGEDVNNILIADYTHICFDKHSKEYLKGSYIRFSEPMWNILNENPVPLNRNIAVNGF